VGEGILYSGSGKVLVGSGKSSMEVLLKVVFMEEENRYGKWRTVTC